jgi:hypothetical protein
LFVKELQNFMQTTSADHSEGTSPSPAPPCFEVSLVYQDLPTGLHAKKFLNHLLEHCELESEFQLNLWKLDLFHLPEIYEQAVIEASEAGLVLMSLRGDLGLAPETENWLMQWIDRRGDEECALAVLIDCNMQRLDSVGQTLFQLQHATRSSQVRLFVGFVPATTTTTAAVPIKESQYSQPLWVVGEPLTNGVDIHGEGGINE